MSRRARITCAAPLVIAAVVLITAAGLIAGCGTNSGSGSSSDGGDSALSTNDRESAGDAAQPAAGSGVDKSAAQGESDGQDSQASVPSASSPSTHYLVRTGDLSLLVARGTLSATVDHAKAITTAMGGYVMSSSVGRLATNADTLEEATLDGTVTTTDVSVRRAETNASGASYASLVVRVPERQFDAAIKRLSKLGSVQTATTSSEDVTSQYVDLRARLRHYRAVERRLLGFLSETTTVSQMLAVQDRVDEVQLTIEQISAQIKAMRETTTYGTLSVSIAEKDSPATTVSASNTFGGTLRNSLAALGSTARVVALVLTALLPWLIVLGALVAVAWYVVRRVRRSRRQATPPSVTP